MTGREIAFQVLRRVEEGGAFASRALDAALAQGGALDPREAGLATELVYGTLRRALALDAALARHASRPLAQVDPAARVALRLGAYQLLHLGTPPHAAVSEAVSLARSAEHGRAAGFVNAVLRALARDPRPAPAPALAEDPAGHVAAAEAVPRWLAEDWVAWLGPEEALALARAMNQPAPLTLRSPRRDELLARLSAAGVEAAAAARSPDGVVVRSASVHAVARAAGALPFQVQDEAAQLVSLFAAGELRGRDARVLDACAAPGGKTFHLAELLGPRCEVVAIELHPRKAEELRKEAERRGLGGRVRVVCADAARPVPGLAEGSFDAVLVDAPCTGTGTLRRHPELKLRRAAGDPGRLAEAQRAILAACARYARPGAPVAYSVCALTRAEGPELVAWALGQGLARTAPPPGFPGDVLTAAGDLLTLPHRHGCDGFYAARLVRA
jgi:16S rRNA (cytosine967-C5)-methyltransferase